MIDREIAVVTRDGSMTTFVTHPEEGGPHPVVLFFMDAPGKRNELRDMARRLGTAGYYVALPNLYYRQTPHFNVFSGDPAHTADRMWELKASLDNDLVLSDTEALLALADQDPAADAGRVGCVGYCMSGPFSFAAACVYPERIRAAASIYGIELSGPGSPAEQIEQARGELYFACAEFDDHAPPEMVEALEERLAATGANARVEHYPGTHHGFAFPSRDGAYDQAAAERHWERLHSLFARNLG